MKLIVKAVINMEEKRGLERYRIINKLNDRNSVFLAENINDGSLWVEKIIGNESIVFIFFCRNQQRLSINTDEIE